MILGYATATMTMYLYCCRLFSGAPWLAMERADVARAAVRP
jgi:hypothetical protein